MQFKVTCVLSQDKVWRQKPREKVWKGIEWGRVEKHKNGSFEHYLNTFVETFEQCVGTQEVERSVFPTFCHVEILCRRKLRVSWIYQMAVTEVSAELLHNAAKNLEKL